MAKTSLLFVSVFVIATCGLGYELIAGTVASYLLGDSITQFSTAIGLYLFALGIGVGYLAERIATAITVGELIGPLVLGLGPAALLHVLASTAIDYARAELVLRRPTHASLGALRALIRAIGYLARRPVARLSMTCTWWPSAR